MTGLAIRTRLLVRKKKEDKIEIELKQFRMDNYVKENNRMNPYIHYYRGSHPKHKKEIEEGITEWKEKSFSGRDHNNIAILKQHTWDYSK